MTRKLRDTKSSDPLPDAVTEFITSGSSSVLIDSDPELPAFPHASSNQGSLADSDATMHVRQFAATPIAVGLPRVSGYEIVEELGRGGMGVVYKAWQHSLQRSVALKMILAGSFAGPQDLDRFRAEAMAIARLHHPNLLSIYEIGECERLPFYGMEYMEGGSLARRLNGAPIQPRVAAGLVRNLAQAMDYAHKNGIVHRDLKPANILLAGGDDIPLQDCVAKITDFGIAKHLHHDSSYTRTGDILGTPNYMAPEQAMGRPGQIGPAVDIYSLGAILYELLTGRPPFQGATGADVLLLLARQDPERPSHWVRSLPRDLETICLKCLEKDPTRRYVSAGALADDLQRFLNSEPIEAKPASLLDRTIKWTRRRPALAAIVLMAACTAALAFGMMAQMTRQAMDHAHEEEELRGVATSQLRIQARLTAHSQELLADAYLDRGIHLAERGDVRRGMHWMVRALDINQKIAREPGDANDLESVIRMNIAAWGECVSGREKMLPHWTWVWDVAFVPEQPFVATASRDRTVQVWHTQTAQRVGPPLEHPFPVWGLAFHPDGKTLFTICGDSEHGSGGWLTVYRADASKPGHFVPRGTPMMLPFSLGRMTMNAAGDRIWITSNAEGIAFLLAFDAAGPGNGLSMVGDVMAGHIFGVFNSDGSMLATIAGEAHSNGTRAAQPRQHVQLWDGRSGAALGKPLEHNGLVRTVAFSNDGRHLIVGAANGVDFRSGETSQILVWDVANRKRASNSVALAGRIKACAVAGSSDLFAISIFEYAPGAKADRINVTDGKVMLWQLHADGRIETHGEPLRPHHVVWSMQFSPDSRMLLAGSENSGAYLWSVSNGQQLLPTIWHDGNCTSVAFRKNGRQVVTASAGGSYNASARIWDVPRFGHIGRPLPQRSGIRGSCWDEDGESVWICTGDHQTRWDPIKGKRIADIPLPEFTYHLNSARDGKRFFLNFGHHQLHELDRNTGAVKLLDGLPDYKRGGDFYRYDIASQTFLRCWSQPGRFQMLDEQLKPASREVIMPKYALGAIAHNSNSNTLVVSRSILTRSNELVLFNASDLTVRHTIALKNTTPAIAFSGDGKTLAYGGLDRQVQRIDVATAKPVGAPLLQEQVVRWISFLNNDRCLVTGSEKGQILLWDLPTGKRIGPAYEHNEGLIATEVNSSGTRLLASTHGRMAMTWRFPEPVQGSVEQVRSWVETLTELELTESSAFVPIEGQALLDRRKLTRY